MKLVAVDKYNVSHDLPDPDEIASWIRTNRKARGMSLAAVAKRIGVKRQAVWSWEHEVSSPTADKLAKMMSVFIEEDEGDGDPVEAMEKVLGV